MRGAVGVGPVLKSCIPRIIPLTTMRVGWLVEPLALVLPARVLQTIPNIKMQWFVYFTNNPH